MNIYIRSQANDLFKYLTDQQSAALSAMAEHLEYSSGELVHSANELQTAISIVIGGTMELKSEAGKSVGYVYPGEIVGETGFLNSDPCPLNLYCIKDCEVLKLCYDALNDFCAISSDNSARIHAALNDSLCLKVIRLTHRRDDD